jgi:hypothetical protein
MVKGVNAKGVNAKAVNAKAVNAKGVKAKDTKATNGFTVIEFKGLNQTDTTIFVSLGLSVSVTLKIPFNSTNKEKNDQIEGAKKSIIAKSTK